MNNSMAYLNNICSMTGYTPKTDIWEVLSEADENKIEDIVEEIFKTVKDDYIYLTEFIMFLNWKCWEHYDKGNEDISELYSKLFYEKQNYAYDHFNDEELSYYFQITD